MVLGSPKQRNLAPGATRHEAFDLAADTLATALPVFEETGVVVAVEPFGPEETNFLLTAAEAVELIGRLGSPHVRLQLDCKSMARESVPMTELIARHKALLAHFHANDPNRRGPGFGELDFTPIFRALAKRIIAAGSPSRSSTFRPAWRRWPARAFATWRNAWKTGEMESSVVRHSNGTL